MLARYACHLCGCVCIDVRTFNPIGQIHSVSSMLSYGVPVYLTTGTDMLIPACTPPVGLDGWVSRSPSGFDDDMHTDLHGTICTYV